MRLLIVSKTSFTDHVLGTTQAQNNGGNFGYQGNSTEISTQPGLMPNMPMMPNMPNMPNMPMPPANQGALVYAGQYNPSGYNPSGYNNNLPVRSSLTLRAVLGCHSSCYAWMLVSTSTPLSFPK
jgi:hypothetical protein